MKRFLSKYCALFFLTVVFVSCDTAVDVNAEFRERYVLTSILDCEKENQIVFLTKTYDNTISGRDPDVNSIFVRNAEIKIWYRYEVYDFMDTVIEDKDGNLFE